MARHGESRTGWRQDVGTCEGRRLHKARERNQKKTRIARTWGKGGSSEGGMEGHGRMYGG